MINNACLPSFLSSTGLDAELEAANKESGCVKMKLRVQENDLDGLRLKLSEREDELDLRYSK